MAEAAKKKVKSLRWGLAELEREVRVLKQPVSNVGFPNQEPAQEGLQAGSGQPVSVCGTEDAPAELWGSDVPRRGRR